MSIFEAPLLMVCPEAPLLDAAVQPKEHACRRGAIGLWSNGEIAPRHSQEKLTDKWGICSGSKPDRLKGKLIGRRLQMVHIALIVRII